MKSRMHNAWMLVILIGLVFFSASQVHADEGIANLGERRLMFVENVGQFASGVRYQVQGLGATAYLADDAIWFKLTELPSRSAGPKHEALASLSQPKGRETSLRLEFAGANSNARLVPMSRLETKVSYLKGNSPANWHADVPVWGGVRYADLYPGMDLEITGDTGHWAWRLVVREPDQAWSGQEAGMAMLSQVGLRADGGKGIKIGDGLVWIDTNLGDLVLPLIEVVGSESVPSPTMAGDQLVVTPFASPLKSTLSGVQPSADSDLIFSTYLGGGEKDEAFDIALGSDGSMYIVGYTWSSGFPTTPQAYDGLLNGDYDSFILKMPGDGSALTYATYLGGSMDDSATAVAVDGDGNAYLTGVTFSTDYPTSTLAYDGSLGSTDPEEGDAFATKLNASGTGLIYSTYLGSDADDRGWDIALKDGYVYIVGETWPHHSVPFPTTPGAYDGTHGGKTDVFVAKVNLNGSDLVYSTLVGFAGDEEAYSVALDASGNTYIVGETSSTGFATTGAFDETHEGDEYAMDAFVAKLNSSGSARVYATYLGGSENEWAEAMTIDSEGCVYVTGYTYSTDFPTTTLAYDGSHNGEFDIFVTKLNADGSDLVYSTFYGGSDDEDAFGIAIDSEKRAHIVGYTFSSDFPVTPGAYDTSLGGSRDAFVVKFEADGSGVIYSTYFGGTDNVVDSAGDCANAVVVDSSDDIYLTGLAWSLNFPAKNAYDGSHNGDADAFAAKMTLPDGVSYYVTMRTNAGSVSPTSDWYEPNAGLAIGVTAPTAGSGEQFSWVGWTGEGEGSYTGPSQSASITVLDFITQTASWSHQFMLTVATSPAGLATIGGSGWKTAGSVAATGTAPLTISNGGTLYTFAGWRIDGTPLSGNPINVAMGGAHTATAHYSVTENEPPNTVSVSPSGGWGTPGTVLYFTAEYTDPDGADNIRYADILVNSSTNTTRSIAARYNVQDNKMQINNPAKNNAFRAAAKTPGVAGILKHMFGILDVGKSSVVKVGNTLRITWAIQFTSKMSGQTHSPYLRVEDVQGEADGWNDHGSFVVNRRPNYLIPPTELSPRNGVASVNGLYWFDPAYRDLDREWTLHTLYFLIADSMPSDSAPDSQVPHGVYLKYKHNGGVGNGELYIWGGTAWLGPYQPNGTTGPVETTNATVITRWSKPIYANFCTIKVLWRLQFKTSFLGKHKLYMRAIDTMGAENGGDTGWKWKGTIELH